MLCDFEKKVEKSLLDCGVLFSGDLKIGAAVSGGADSVSLLLSLCSVLKKYSIPLYVITINHNIRHKNETEGDAVFVEQLCQNLKKNGFLVNFKCITFEENQVSKLSGSRKGGIEEAARFLRYQAFDNFILSNKLDYLCLAHNKNDQLETLLMRFLQGSGLDGLCGIKQKRQKFIRPLLDFERSEIEVYLNSKNQSWRTDSTNTNQNYLRNKIRLSLVPFLKENFPGWEKALISGQKKAMEDAAFISYIVNNCDVNKNMGADNCNYSADNCNYGADNCNYGADSCNYGADSCNYGADICNYGADNCNYRAFPAITKRLILRKFNEAGISCRVPDSFLQELCKEINNSKSVKKFFNGYEIIIKNNEVLVKKAVKKHTDLVFFDIIEHDGIFNFPFGIMSVLEGKIYINDNSLSCSVKMPFCVRNVTSGDTIATADGSLKKVRDIFSDWHVLQEHKELIPLILDVQTGEIVCIAASFLGYNDWVVKNEK